MDLNRSFQRRAEAAEVDQGESVPASEFQRSNDSPDLQEPDWVHCSSDRRKWRPSNKETGSPNTRVSLPSNTNSFSALWHRTGGAEPILIVGASSGSPLNDNPSPTAGTCHARAHPHRRWLRFQDERRPAASASRKKRSRYSSSSSGGWPANEMVFTATRGLILAGGAPRQHDN